MDLISREPAGTAVNGTLPRLPVRVAPTEVYIGNATGFAARLTVQCILGTFGEEAGPCLRSSPRTWWSG